MFYFCIIFSFVRRIRYERSLGKINSVILWEGIFKKFLVFGVGIEVVVEFMVRGVDQGRGGKGSMEKGRRVFGVVGGCGVQGERLSFQRRYWVVVVNCGKLENFLFLSYFIRGDRDWIVIVVWEGLGLFKGFSFSF